uniref:Uncharacterized protein n=1 Tax=Arundo donax TaxID=35708 RepID=A0A0A9CPA5_ARUDO
MRAKACVNSSYPENLPMSMERPTAPRLYTLVNVRILCGGGAEGQEFLFNRAPSLIAESIELKAISD